MYKVGDAVEMSGFHNYLTPFIGKYRVAAVDDRILRLKLIEVLLPDGKTIPASDNLSQIDDIDVAATNFDKPLETRLHQMQEDVAALLKRVAKT